MINKHKGTKKAFTQGTHRLMPPEETVARVKRFMPVMGITRIANVTGLDTIGIPVVMVCRPNSRSIAVSQGKGFDLASAKASGLMESVESYHAEHITLPLKLGSLEDLRYSHDVADVDGLPRLSDSNFTPHAPILWIEGHDLIGDTPMWVPYEMVHLAYTVPLPSGHGCFMASSNGPGSGNHILEAISHGICELVERDATTLWHLLGPASKARTRIKLDTVDDPRCRQILAKFEAADVSVAAWDMTSDLGIPAVLCRILQRSRPPITVMRPASGMGCHPTREVALLRALTEAAQSRLTFISGARDDLDRSEYDHFLDPRTYDVWQASMDEEAQRDFKDMPTRRSETFEEDVRWEIERLKKRGIEQVIVVDLTKPEFEIPVARVIIPGLEGIDHSTKFVPGERARALLQKAA